MRIVGKGTLATVQYNEQLTEGNSWEPLSTKHLIERNLGRTVQRFIEGNDFQEPAIDHIVKGNSKNCSTNSSQKAFGKLDPDGKSA